MAAAPSLIRRCEAAIGVRQREAIGLRVPSPLAQMTRRG